MPDKLVQSQVWNIGCVRTDPPSGVRKEWWTFLMDDGLGEQLHDFKIPTPLVQIESFTTTTSKFQTSTNDRRR